jgi:hypothetical protein
MKHPQKDQKMGREGSFFASQKIMHALQTANVALNCAGYCAFDYQIIK